MRYFALFFIVIFLLFTYWQFNDPDPIWWSTLYLIPAYVSYRAFRGSYNFELLTTLIALYLAGAVQTWMQMSTYEGYFTDGAGLAMKTENQELAREASGMAICAMVFVLYAAYAMFRMYRHSRLRTTEATYEMQ